MKATVCALVLDFGGVVTRTLFESHDLTERALGLTPGTLTWRGPFDPENDALWQRMQADEISERDYWLTRTREVGELIGEDWSSTQDFVRRARGNDVDAILRPEALAAIEAVKRAGYIVAVLTNELDLFYGPEFREQVELTHSFDAIVDGTYTKILKPDPRSYRLLLDAIGREPADCVFVDDQRRNVDGAAAIGMNVVHFDVRDPQASFAKAVAFFELARMPTWEASDV